MRNRTKRIRCFLPGDYVTLGSDWYDMISKAYPKLPQSGLVIAITNGRRRPSENGRMTTGTLLLNNSQIVVGEIELTYEKIIVPID